MISKVNQANYRSSLFRHLDGIGIAPAAYLLHEKGILTYLSKNKICKLDTIATEFNGNEGYLNVALRLLASQGWLTQKIDNTKNTVSYSITNNGKIAFKYVPLYKEAVELLKFTEKFHPRKFEIEPFRKLEKLFKNYKNRYDLDECNDSKEKEIQDQILTHIEGIIVGPTTVHLGMGGMFHKYFMEASFKPEEFHKDAQSFRTLLDVFTHLEWFKKNKDTYQFTEKGLFFAKRASAYGVTVSYIPTFRKLDELTFGDAEYFSKSKGKTEEHVDREMNVWGSGGAHTSYFKVVDDIIIDLFNKPIEEQPKGILDMGCGNGAFIQHIYEVIANQTQRGKVLDQYPIFLVGADYNEAALKITKANLIAADIWAKIVWGDIGRPDLLANDLQENYGINLKDLLNVRTFLDHNRIWAAPKKINKERVSKSSGAFVTKGKRISNNHVEDALLEHLTKWKPFVEKFGLLIIELHTINPSLAAQNIGKTAVTAYDATHGYSDQYIVEVDIFHEVAVEAGLKLNDKHFRRFPNSDLATVSINLLQG